MTKALMRNLEKDQLKMAHQNSLDLFRSLIAEAVLHEKGFTVETVKKWRKTGRLASDWQERQALLLIEAESLDSTELDGLPDQDYDETGNSTIDDRE